MSTIRIGPKASLKVSVSTIVLSPTDVPHTPPNRHAAVVPMQAKHLKPVAAILVRAALAHVAVGQSLKVDVLSIAPNNVWVLCEFANLHLRKRLGAAVQGFTELGKGKAFTDC